MTDSTEIRHAAFLISQAACAMIEMESMKAANVMREAQGFTIAYGEEVFLELLAKYGIHHNAAIKTLNGE
jgi:hypothetical protein